METRNSIIMLKCGEKLHRLNKIQMKWLGSHKPAHPKFKFLGERYINSFEGWQWH